MRQHDHKMIKSTFGRTLSLLNALLFLGTTPIHGTDNTATSRLLHIQSPVHDDEAPVIPSTHSDFLSPSTSAHHTMIPIFCSDGFQEYPIEVPAGGTVDDILFELSQDPRVLREPEDVLDHRGNRRERCRPSIRSRDWSGNTCGHRMASNTGHGALV